MPNLVLLVVFFEKKGPSPFSPMARHQIHWLGKTTAPKKLSLIHSGTKFHEKATGLVLALANQAEDETQCFASLLDVHS